MITVTLISWIATAVFIIAIVLLFKYFTGKHKPYNERSGMEKIACGLFSMFRSNVEDTARSVNSPRVLKQQAMQELEDALKNLKQSYIDGKVNMARALGELKNQKVTLSEQPGKLRASAQTWKRKYEQSVRDGQPIEAYKKTSVTFLSKVSQANENIVKIDKSIDKLEIGIATAEAEYASQKVELEMLRSNLLASTDVERIDLDSALSRIGSLTSELTAQLDAARIRSEVESEIRNEESSLTEDMEAAFNNL